MISILFSGFTSPILSSVYTVSLFLIGHSSSVVLGIIDRQDNVIIKYIFSALYYIFPNLEKFNIRNDVLYNSTPVFQTLVLTIVYAMAYGAALFLIAKFIFDRREY